jgi:NADH dehydrogenase [ubiquinone] 1 alpha subcomplex assembly factor 7
MEAALYGEGGFFATGQGARRDFVTSPEVGSLFGACAARALDQYWHALDDPDPFLVVEAGAGNGRLARDIWRAEPECLPALRYVLVERSAALRGEQRTRLPLDPPDEALGPFVRRTGEDAPVPAAGAGPIFASLAEMPALQVGAAVVLANELLDNLPFGVAEWDGERWLEVRVGLEGDRFVEVLVPMQEPGSDDLAAGTRVALPRGVRAWLAECDKVLRHGFVVLIDYMTDEPALHLRTYRGHSLGSDPLEAPGTHDITADVVVEHVIAIASGFSVTTDTTQAAWLRSLGIEDLADEGARAWRAGAHRGDLDALAGRSRVHEAEILTDPAGLGAHRVVVVAR